MSWGEAPRGEGYTRTRWSRGRVERVGGLKKAGVFYVEEGQNLVAEAENSGHMSKMSRRGGVFKGTAENGVQGAQAALEGAIKPNNATFDIRKNA